MAYSDNFPAVRPVFQSDFANGGRIDPRITFSRSDTPPTYAAPSAVHYWSNEKHLSSENLLLQSSNFITSWFPNGINGTPTGGQADPAGGTDGFTVVEDSAVGAIHRIFQTANASGDLAFTVYAKQNSGTRYLTLTLFNANNNWSGATFDLAGGSPATGSGSSSVFTSVSATQTASGNGYYKCTLKATGALAGTAYIYLGSSTAAPAGTYGSVPYTGDGTSSLDIAFASLTTTGATDYNATTTQLHREYSPTLKSVSTAGQPRFEYSPTDSASMGLLIEGQSQNLLPNGATGYNSSDVFSWTTMYSNFAQNAAIAPTGSLEATHFYEDTEPTTQHRITVSVTATAAAHTLSGYFKSAGRDDVQFRVTNGGVNYWAKFNFSTETASDAGNPFSSLRVSSVGNGWYRFEATTPTLTAGSTTIYVNLYNGSMTYTGDGYSGVLFYGLQFEAGAASSLIATVDSAVTRAADSASVDLTQAGFNGGPFSIVSETEGGQGVYPRAWTLTDGTLDNRLTVYRNSGTATTSTNWFYYGASEGSAQVSSSVTGSASAGKLAVSYDTNDVSFCASGGSVTNDTSAVIPKNITTLIFGSQANGTANKLNGHIKRLALYSEPLSDSNLQALTS